MVRSEAPVPPPAAAMALADLFAELRHVRRITVRQIATRTRLSDSHVSEVLRGLKAPSADAADRIAVALGADPSQRTRIRLLAEAVADERRRRRSSTKEPTSAPPRPTHASTVCEATESHLYELPAAPDERQIGIVTGDIRRVKQADIWVNAENTNMQMARVEEHSISAVIRFEGARLDGAGRVVVDSIADELTRQTSGRTPVAPGTAIVTGAGELATKNGVRNVIHVAAVQGEPGAGYRQVREVGRCVTHALREAEMLTSPGTSRSTILFPILGVGVGGGDLEPTVRALLGAAVAHFSTERHTRIGTILFLAYTELERATCLTIFDGNSRLVPATPSGADTDRA
ncbi:MAG TPA: helix-turn-helix domain-containing protein [Pseudonocardiaceae bacterium]